MPKRFSSVELFETIDSTNLEAKRRANTGARGPLWIVALRQTAGYGRRGRRWIQAEGDFAATLLIEPDGLIEDAGQISFVAAIAVAEAIRAHIPRVALTLKWPNDVLLNGGKVAGILPELLDTPAGRMIALGIGINIISKPEDVSYQSARLIDALDGSAPPSPMALLDTLDDRMNTWRKVWLDQGFAPVREAWLEYAAGRGQRITVRLPGQDLKGVFEDIDPSGGLILRMGDHRRVIAAGDVFFTKPRA